MRTKASVALTALVVLIAAGAAWASTQGAAKAAAKAWCCYPGSPCCFPGSDCCDDDCCYPGSPCCFPGSDCCLSATKAAVKVTAKRDCCAGGEVCCDPASACCFAAK